MNRKILLGVIVVALLAVAFVIWKNLPYFQAKQEVVPEIQQEVISTATPTPVTTKLPEPVTTSPKPTSSIVATPRATPQAPQAVAPVSAKTDLLQANFYTLPGLSYSLRLPKGFIASTTSQSATSSPVSIHRIGDTNEPPEFEILASQLLRTEEINEIIGEVGEDGFINSVIDYSKQSLNEYSVTSTKKSVINGRTFYVIMATYAGGDTGKPVTQYSYYTFTTKSIFAFLVEGYTPLFPQYKDAAVQSISSVIITP